MTNHNLALVEASAPAPGPSEKERRAIEAWLHGKARDTEIAYSIALGQFIDACGHPTLADALATENIAAESIAAYRASLAKKAPATIAARQSALRKLLIELWRWRVVPVAYDYMLPRQPLPSLAPAVYPSREQCMAVIAAEPDTQTRLLLQLLYGLGLRLNEALNIQWKHIVRQPDGQVVLWLVGKGKGGGKEALLEVCPPDGVEAPFLRALAADLREAAEAVRWKGKVFSLPARTAQDRIVRAWRRGGVTELRRLDGSPVDGPSAHTWRHCFCTHAQEAGASIAETKGTSRHEHDKTLARYTHRAPENPARRW